MYERIYSRSQIDDLIISREKKNLIIVDTRSSVDKGYRANDHLRMLKTNHKYQRGLIYDAQNNPHECFLLVKPDA